MVVRHSNTSLPAMIWLCILVEASVRSLCSTWGERGGSGLRPCNPSAIRGVPGRHATCERPGTEVRSMAGVRTAWDSPRLMVRAEGEWGGEVEGEGGEAQSKRADGVGGQGHSFGV